ncbi:MAG TPA: winged helix-turn-helix domain-containing protein [Vicinamibacterales bacterium]|nr:winged helix-turn-helix domain-containing protein [Vicinamibacterales bacterium]
MRAAQVVRFGSFELDAARRRLGSGAHDVHLTRKAFELLALLLDEAPRVVSKREIHERIWPGTFVSDAALVGLVKELRRALHDRDVQSPLIRTVHGVGYAIAAPVKRQRPAPPPDATGSHWLVANGKRLPLREGVNTIGRDPACDVWLNFSSVSRHHARIVIDGSGTRVEDAGSKNGTRLGNVPLTEPATLEDGAMLRVGDVRLSYRTATAGLSTETRGSTVDERPRARASRREEPSR